MAKSKWGITFEGFDELMGKLDKLGGDLKQVTEECLSVAPDVIGPKLHADMERHHRTGKTDKSIVDKGHVEWSGTVASMSVGFNLKDGGMPSIFLMYGTPRMKKNTKLYNDVYGKATREEIEKLQALIIADEIYNHMGG